MADIKKTNIYNYLKTKFSNTASHIKMNGTQSAGSSDLIARADHVHPSDTSRAPKSHASSNSGDYGVSTASNYGHAKASGTTPKVDGTAAVGSETGSFARGDHVHPTDTSRAPTGHASSATTYGVGSASNYGHVKVDNSLSGSSTNPVQNSLIKNALDLKQNEVETQSKIVGFTNKDRITLERVIERMNNPSLKALFLRPAGSSSTYYVFCDNIKVGKTNANSLGLYLDGAKYDAVASSVVLKNIDGTVIKNFDDRGSDPAAFSAMIYASDLPVGIHYLYAEATYSDGSVRKSNILSVFVKDTNNLLDYNQWSCGDYNENDNGFAGQPIITNIYSITGENCLKLKNNGSSTIFVSASIPCLANTEYTIKCKVYNPSSVRPALILRDNTWENAAVYFPKSDGWVDLQLSYTSQSSASRIYVQFNLVSNSEFYVDDISLTLS